jgi:single-stranded-DNA-specific exonuclease
LAEDPDEAVGYAQELCNKNVDRQTIENQIYCEACAMIEAENQNGDCKVIVLAKDDWHTGIIGIVASKLNDKYAMPCVLISFAGDVGKGSGRSMSSFSLYDALDASSDLLVQYGGHSLAVGLTVTRENFEPLKNALKAYAESHTAGEEKTTSAECELDETFTIKHAEEIYKLEPYGLENPVPVFMIRNAKIGDCVYINDGRNLKFSVIKGNSVFPAILFGVENMGFEFMNGDCLDILATADVNHYRGRDSLQLLIKDIRHCEASRNALERSVAIYHILVNKTDGASGVTREELAVSIPARDDFTKIYRLAVRAADKINLHTLPIKLTLEAEGTNMNYCKLRIALDVFAELGIFETSCSDDGEFAEITAKNTQNAKIDLSHSPLLSRLKKLLG